MPSTASRCLAERRERREQVAKELPFEQPHRHFSHLMGAVLKDPVLATPAGLALVRKSVEHWRYLRRPCDIGFPKTRDQGGIKDAGWTGFSCE
jgi:hypothetical protein